MIVSKNIFACVFLILLFIGYIGQSPKEGLHLLLEGRMANTEEQSTKILFFDDFEDGDMEGWVIEQPGWKIEKEGKNHVLSGTSSEEIRYLGNWVNYVFESEFKVIEGELNFFYRNSNNGYYIIFVSSSSNDLNLMRVNFISENEPGYHTMLKKASFEILKNKWYKMKIAGEENNIKVFIDDKLLIDYTDSEPLSVGGIAFCPLLNSKVFIDNVKITGVSSNLPSGFKWKKLNGPRGGIGYDVRIHPLNDKILYVSDAFAGVHMSTDGGIFWRAMNNGIITRSGTSSDIIPVFSLTVDEKNPNIIWIGMQGMGAVYKSTDGGKNWVMKSNGIENIPGMEIRGFTVDPNDSNIVYCGGNFSQDPTKGNKVRGFIYKTTDGGENWEEILDSGALVRWIIIDPTNTDIIYASTGIFDRFAEKPEGIFKSTDGGETWFNINNGLTNLVVDCITMHPENPNILFAATGKGKEHEDNPGEADGGIFKSVDGGENWTKIYEKPDWKELIVAGIAISSSHPNIMYADTANGLFLRSFDGGNTWEELDNHPPGDWAGAPIAITIHPTNPDIVYINAYAGGVFMSTNGGDSWIDASKGYTGAQIRDIAVDLQDSSYVLTGSRIGPYLSVNGGDDWIGLFYIVYRDKLKTRKWLPGPIDLQSVAIDPTNNKVMLVGEVEYGTIARTTDRGKTWIKVMGPLVFDEKIENWITIYEIEYSNSNPKIVYAATGINEHVINMYDRRKQGFGVYKSTDSGNTWKQINNGLEKTTLNIMSITVHPENPDIAYIGTLNSGIYKTIDGGENWVVINNGLKALEVRSLAIDPKNPEIVYAGLGEGVGMFKTTSGGTLWEEINVGILIECPSFLQRSGQVKQGMSLDQKVDFVVKAYYSVPWTIVTDIEIDPTDPNIIYISDQNSGIYMSVDGGDGWIHIIEGLENKAVNALALSADGMVLYAGTDGGGMFMCGTISEEQKMLSKADSLFREAVNLFEKEDCKNAKEMFLEAKELYERVNLHEKAEEAQEMIDKCDEIQETEEETEQEVQTQEPIEEETEKDAGIGSFVVIMGFLLIFLLRKK